MTKPLVFFDADALFAGAVSSTGAAHLLLRLSEFSLLRGVTSQQATTEAGRNLEDKLPGYVPNFRALVEAAIEVYPDPTPDDLAPYAREADFKDVPILAAACLHGSDYLVTFNVRHYWPRQGGIEVVSPGDLLARIRRQLADLARSAHDP